MYYTLLWLVEVLRDQLGFGCGVRSQLDIVIVSKRQHEPF